MGQPSVNWGIGSQYHLSDLWDVGRIANPLHTSPRSFEIIGQQASSIQGNTDTE
jgi:hypothetical protein